MINLILYISIVVSIVLVVFYGFCNYRMRKIVKTQDAELEKYAAIAEEHRVKMLSRPNSEIDLNNVSFSVDHSALKVLNQEIIDVLTEILEDVSLKKNYKDNVVALRNELLRREGRLVQAENVDVQDDGTGLLADRIQSVFAKLTKNELNLCVMLLQGKTTKEIAELTNREVRSVESSRNRLRKKLELEKGTDLKAFLLGKIGDEGALP